MAESKELQTQAERRIPAESRCEADGSETAADNPPVNPAGDQSEWATEGVCVGHTCGGHRHGRGAKAHSQPLRALAASMLLAGGYMIAEIAGGLWTHSLALLADAGHMFSDVAALGLSLFAMWMARRPPSSQHTYGFYRAEILAAVVNAAALIAVAIGIFVEAYGRWQQPPEVLGLPMLGIAVGGLAVNLVMLKLLGHDHTHSLNVRGAWLHVLGDTLGSVGTILAAAAVWWQGWTWVDPAASVLIAALVIFSAWRLLAESVAVLMESAPRGINVDAVFAAMRELPGVDDVHDLHVWTVTSGLDALSAHVTTSATPPHDLLANIGGMLRRRFGIDHVTIQIEPPDFDACRNVDSCRNHGRHA